MMYGYGAAGFLSWLPMTIVMLLVTGGLVVLVVVLVRGTRDRWAGGHYAPPAWPTSPGPQHDDPESVLRHRFARGEIDETEYNARLEVLRRK
jgi:putative membrane protein